MKYRTNIAGVVLVLLAGVTARAEITVPLSYSRHTGSRAPQVYSSDASDGTAAGLDAPRTLNWTLDTSRTPELRQWADTKLKPAVDQWYPVWVECLASDGVTAPKHFTITIKAMDGVAATGGTDVEVSESWIKEQIAQPGNWNEAVGSVIHELVHVVQQYGNDRPGTAATPVWLMEGIADYFRWFHYEPVAHRPKMTAQEGAKAHYTDSYQTTAGFLEYVCKNHGHEFVIRMNAALREHRYSPNLWTAYSGMSVENLWKAYVASLPQT
jgi:hypothetical protein